MDPNNNKSTKFSGRDQFCVEDEKGVPNSKLCGRSSSRSKIIAGRFRRGTAEQTTSSCAIGQGIGLHPDIQIKDKVLCLGEDEIRESGIPYTIVRPCALTEEPAGANLIFDQGDNITGKISCAEVARIYVAALKSPYAHDNTFE
ncbi:hypothetical protein P3S68_019540 [Capsicum galapagoense]